MTWRVDVITLFPRMIEAPLAESILGKAQQRGLFQATARDLRPFGEGKHRITDDSPYGGGAGMVMKPEPLVSAIEAARAELPGCPVVLLDPQGPRFAQNTASRWSQLPGLVLACGRYEGVDERVRRYVDETLSVGDFVMTGGEFAALCVIDAVVRLLPGVLGNDTSIDQESFNQGLLEGPQYTRPVDYRGDLVPEVLLSGNHAIVKRWRRQQALARTWQVRPDLLETLSLSKDDEIFLRDLREAENRSIAAGRSSSDDDSSAG